MESDPLYTQMSEVLAACPLQAGPLYTTFRDLSLSVEWKGLRVLELGSSGWAVIIGHKRRDDPLKAVLPLPLHTSSLLPSSLRAIFSALSNLTPEMIPPPLPPLIVDADTLRQDLKARQDSSKAVESAEEQPGSVDESLDKEMIYMGIVGTDSSVVYYKLTKGIKKPADIPDE